MGRPLRGRINGKNGRFLQIFDLSEVVISFDAFALRGGTESPKFQTGYTEIPVECPKNEFIQKL